MSSRRSALRLVLAGGIAIPVSIAVISLFPASSRLVPFVISMALVAVIAITGGWQARQALATGAIPAGRGIALAVTGLTVGMVAALSAVSALMSMLR